MSTSRQVELAESMLRGMGLVDDFASSAEIARDVFEAEDMVDFTPRELLLDRLADRVGASVARQLKTQLQHSVTIE